MAIDEHKVKLEKKVITALRLVYDPEIPVNVYDLGLIYEIKIDDNNNVDIVMTLTAPNCPEAESIPVNIKDTVSMVTEVEEVNVKIVFDPPWTMDNLSDEAKLELGML